MRTLRSLLWPGLVAFTLLAVITLCGCRTPDAGEPRITEQDQTFNLPYAVVWETLANEFGEQYPMEQVEKFNGMARTEFIICTHEIDRYAFQPQVWKANWTQAKARAFFQVSKISDTQTRVQINGFFIRYNDHSTSAWHRWPSKGEWERQLMDALTAELQQVHASR